MCDLARFVRMLKLIVEYREQLGLGRIGQLHALG